MAMLFFSLLFPPPLRLTNKHFTDDLNIRYFLHVQDAFRIYSGKRRKRVFCLSVLFRGSSGLSTAFNTWQMKKKKCACESGRVALNDCSSTFLHRLSMPKGCKY